MVNQGLTRIPQMTLKSMRANDGDQRAAARTKGIEDPTLKSLTFRWAICQRRNSGGWREVVVAPSSASLQFP